MPGTGRWAPGFAFSNISAAGPPKTAAGISLAQPGKSKGIVLTAVFYQAGFEKFSLCRSVINEIKQHYFFFIAILSERSNKHFICQIPGKNWTKVLTEAIGNRFPSLLILKEKTRMCEGLKEGRGS